MRTIAVHMSSGCDVLIDRTTPWGNPFTHKPSALAEVRVDSRDEAIEAFAEWVTESLDPKAVWIRDHVHTLRGKRLGCWCPPRRCHGEVLADMADGREVRVQKALW